jgi:hypothetical protein
VLLINGTWFFLLPPLDLIIFNNGLFVMESYIFKLLIFIIVLGLMLGYSNYYLNKKNTYSSTIFILSMFKNFLILCFAPFAFLMFFIMF